jgi:hypothetical protein
MPLSTNNIFAIDKPDERRCKIVSFTDGHKILAINISNPFNGEELHVHFGRVAYFSGPVTWKGANFRLAMGDELKQFAEETRQAFATLEKYMLFIIDTDERLQVRIFAFFATLEDQLGKHPSITVESFGISPHP